MGVPARWLIAVEKIEGTAELAGRIIAASEGRLTPREITSTDARRGSSVRHDIEALPGQYQNGHVVVICTHAALMMSDLRAFHGWHLIVDEVPNVLLMAEVQSKLDLHFFETHYSLSIINEKWSSVSLTEAGKRIDGADLQDDHGHRYLRLFHQRVADAAQRDRAVACDLRAWSDMLKPGLKWTWWSLFSVRELEAFQTVRFLGNRFTDSVSAKIMKRWESGVEWVSKSSFGDRPLEHRTVNVCYFSAERYPSITFFQSEKGQKALGQIAAFIAADAPHDKMIWSCNAVAKKALDSRLPRGGYLPPRQAGSDIWMHCTHAAMIYSARPSDNVRAVLGTVGVTPEEWMATTEWEAILQFVTRTSIRDVASADEATVYVFDRQQADFLLSYFASQPHMVARGKYVDLALDLDKDKAGPKPRTYSPDEIEARQADRRAKRAGYERARRARLKAGA